MYTEWCFGGCPVAKSVILGSSDERTCKKRIVWGIRGSHANIKGWIIPDWKKNKSSKAYSSHWISFLVFFLPSPFCLQYFSLGPILNVCTINILFICAILTPSPFILPVYPGTFKQEEPRESRQEEDKGVPAMALKFLGNIQKAVTCPICLQCLTEPLSLGCGHSFCQTCIIGNKETDISPGGENSCPVCGIQYSRERYAQQ